MSDNTDKWCERLLWVFDKLAMIVFGIITLFFAWIVASWPKGPE